MPEPLWSGPSSSRGRSRPPGRWAHTAGTRTAALLETPLRLPRSAEIWRDRPDKQSGAVRRPSAHIWGPKKRKRAFSCQDGLPGSFPPWPDPQRWCSPTPERWCWPSSGGCVRSPGRSAEGTPSPLQGHQETHTLSLIHNTELMLHNTTVQSEQTFSTAPAHTEPLWAGTDRPGCQRVGSTQRVNKKVYSVVSGIKMYILFWFQILLLKRDAPARPAERHVTALVLLIWSVFTAVSERTSSLNYWLLWLHKRALSLAGRPSRLGNYPPAGSVWYGTTSETQNMKSTAGIKGGNQSFQKASLQGGQDEKRRSEIQLWWNTRRENI